MSYKFLGPVHLSGQTSLLKKSIDASLRPAAAGTTETTEMHLIWICCVICFSMTIDVFDVSLLYINKTLFYGE